MVRETSLVNFCILTCCFDVLLFSSHNLPQFTIFANAYFVPLYKLWCTVLYHGLYSLILVTFYHTISGIARIFLGGGGLIQHLLVNHVIFALNMTGISQTGNVRA